MQIARTEGFKKSWTHLTQDQKTLARKAIENLATNMHYPALRVKKIKGIENIWEARVSIAIRMTFQLEDNTIILRNIGEHDDILDRP